MEHIGLFAFFGFSIVSVFVVSERNRMKVRTVSDWITDITSLFMHFLVVPALQILIVYGLMSYVMPSWKGSVPSPIWLALLLYLFLDYLWYWNHRLYHAQTPLWNLHKTHHTPEQIDVFVTSRNAIITHFLMVYFWFIGIATYLLNDSTVFLSLVTFGVVINFWGHTSFSLPCNSLINRILTPIIVTPREHLWHHSFDNPHCNYGTVFSFWDRWHGTDYCQTDHPERYGDVKKKTVWNQLIWPFAD